MCLSDMNITCTTDVIILFLNIQFERGRHQDRPLIMASVCCPIDKSHPVNKSLTMD